ncbi:hypothetical protein GCM10010310_27390 [Streptomyces violaceolatus]|uniref:Uncharacterized protein n=1 Tax=Streptomyces violaceolatus TaxID=67378 RepID=A0ABN3SM18_9ACTN
MRVPLRSAGEEAAGAQVSTAFGVGEVVAPQAAGGGAHQRAQGRREATGQGRQAR